MAGQGRLAVVTGASSGIGLELAKLVRATRAKLKFLPELVSGRGTRRGLVEGQC
jgi:short-subunit dehydrogenase involved in D-alanine esterification of teichoic acids